MLRYTALLLCGITLVVGSPVTAPEYDTIVVGLGASGVSCASELARAGRRVLGLEAQPRLGGRVHTATFGDGIVELGAEWIHGTDGSSVYKLAVDNNVTIIPQVMGTKMFWSNGSEVDADLILGLIDFCLEAQKDQPPEPEPLGQYLTKRLQSHIATKYPSLHNDTEFMTALLKFMDQIINNYEASNSWNDVSTAQLSEDLGGNQLMSWHTHGYNTLFHILLNKFNNGPGLTSLTIKLNTEVIQIKWPKDITGHVEVTTADGAVYTAQHVVVTVSLGVLKERHESLFSPPLPPEKTTAIDAIGFGVVAKVTFRFPHRWMSKSFRGVLWRAADEEVLPDEDRWLTRTEGIAVPMQCDTCGTVWFNGDRAKLVESLPEDVVKTKVLGMIRRYLGVGVEVPEPLEMIRSSWYSNRFTRGSWSYESLETPRHPDARGRLAAPLRDAAGVARVLFAGEATDPKHFSTVHGAVDAGRREASRILEHTKI